MSNSGISLVLVILLAVGCFCFFYPQVENFFIFYPQASFDAVPSDWRLSCEDVYFDTEDKKKLHGWYFPLKGNAPLLLFCHGNAGNISHRLENVKLLLDQQLQVFIFDYRGYGKSGGKPSEKGLYLDGLAAYDFIVNRKGISPHKIVPFGRSLGASVAIEIFLRREVKSLILESAFTSTKGMAKTLFPFMLFSPLLPAHYNNLKKITRVNVPKLIIHGEDDEIVPFSMGQKLYQTAKAPKYFCPIKGAGHNDTYVVGGNEYFETLATFVRDSSI
ncbi:MAG: alpha/beta hydrolase [Desulfobacteraceae bacterium]|nr:MAG: alpha/beta hydrolase [Desulfobacteraceae bacterium]